MNTENRLFLLFNDDLWKDFEDNGGIIIDFSGYNELKIKLSWIY